MFRPLPVKVGVLRSIDYLQFFVYLVKIDQKSKEQKSSHRKGFSSVRYINILPEHFSPEVNKKNSLKNNFNK